VAGLGFGSIAFWAVENSFPPTIMASNLTSTQINLPLSFSTLISASVWRGAIEMFIISMVKLIGLSVGLTELAGLNKADGTAPRRRWLYVACGLGTIISAVLGAGPVLLVVESAAGIIVGAKTGLSAVVCGLMFFISYFFYPFFSSIPAAGTGPVLLMVGLLLFENTGKVNWGVTKEALPVFVTAIFTAFTFSVINGIAFGISIHIIMTLFCHDNSLVHTSDTHSPKLEAASEPFESSKLHKFVETPHKATDLSGRRSYGTLAINDPSERDVFVEPGTDSSSFYHALANAALPDNSTSLLSPMIGGESVQSSLESRSILNSGDF
jgi:hypothetical protein